ncbi:YDL157C [Zygosaccharomyces parabailii]|nr:YDL157C [Zygosaccharomyces parabailii]CDH10632.1 uncharacterized protein ZBAI_02418 [Zygosaccharomyces bailii ISA1307]
MSNIVDVFNPPPQRDLSEEETRDCLPCQVMSSLFTLGFGGYLAAGQPFKYTEKERKRGITVAEFEKRNPLWWRAGLRGFGSALVLFGFIRATEGWVWNKNKKYKEF